MSNITTAYQERSFLIPKADFASDSQVDLIGVIMKKHGEATLSAVKLIDENDEYDSFLVEVYDRSFCVKISFDSTAIFYEYMVLKGIEALNIAPVAVVRSSIEYGKTIYYTIQSYEYSENLMTIGGSSILEGDHFNGFSNALTTLHSYSPPTEVHEYLDNTRSYLQYHRLNFDKVMGFVSSDERANFDFATHIYAQTWNEMWSFFEKKESAINQTQLVHGNLNLSTIITNESRFKFVNLENAFFGCPYFDLANITFELQMSGLKEYDFVTKRIKDLSLVENRLSAGKHLEQYRICKYIWTRKRFLDLIKDYVKEIIVLDKKRQAKIVKMGHNFSNNFYRYADIDVFKQNQDHFVKLFHELVLA